MPKSIFARETLNYLGFEISADGYSATDQKIKAIVVYPLSKTFRSLSRFSGSVNFYHKIVEKCELLRPLYRYGMQTQTKSDQKARLFTGRIIKNSKPSLRSTTASHFEKVKAALGKETLYCTQFLMQKPFRPHTRVIFVLLPLFTTLTPVKS